MNRQEVIRLTLDTIGKDVIVVSNIADTSFELCMLGDRDRNFYMLGSFGLAPSIGLGLALSRPEQVVVLNGDGALLFNLGCLATQGRYHPSNLLHIVIDNEAHGATGYQPTASGTNVDLAALAAACGLKACCVRDHAGFVEGLRDLLRAQIPAVLVVKVLEKPSLVAGLPPYSGAAIRERFMLSLRPPHVLHRRQVA